MLSVLIATYNWDIVNLVKELHLQLEKAAIDFEIICIDDASKSVLNKENEKINSLKNCSFEILPKNIGRSAIRNLLAKKANYNWLLFLDADVLPKSKSFIQNYIGETEKNLASVFLGGIAYRNENNSNLIRWKLGKKGEEQPAEVRNKDVYNYFFSANFMIEKSVFNSIQFDETIVTYGCEDLLFSIELKNKNVKIKHIDNEVYHLGIDQNNVFLRKTKESLSNLSILIKSGKTDFSVAKISSVYKKSMRFKIPFFLYGFINILQSIAEKTSSLFAFNLFRLAYLYKKFNR